jgi:uncharacterized protein YqeY
MLKEKIQQDMKDTMRAKDSRKLGVIRMLLAAIKQREVDERIVLDDAQTLAVIDKMIKQRRDSLSYYQNAGRQDLADQESYEITLLETYLPEPLTDNEINDLITKALQETGAHSTKDMGKVMTFLKPKLQGRADVAEVSKKVKGKLASLSSS